ncbi:uncharacterized protein BDR25DRAFT_354180 [Lindgomyces ingoldianus]|uniref:Uncharacterized protein n=1 Tax=Lindgomyces ingoldianus TaxID=673940 RepID=A0ACB6QXA7_9PLEO|nr:uncharacterized protein BDR25DRAFT_354180 [Lindgomyces ingoldianus]KAF2471679.1 hypothetical protein BDR25DRAFT_354180 [Lindgomyces ingoldianus]
MISEVVSTIPDYRISPEGKKMLYLIQQEHSESVNKDSHGKPILGFSCGEERGQKRPGRALIHPQNFRSFLNALRVLVVSNGYNGSCRVLEDPKKSFRAIFRDLVELGSQCVSETLKVLNIDLWKLRFGLESSFEIEQCLLGKGFGMAVHDGRSLSFFVDVRDFQRNTLAKGLPFLGEGLGNGCQAQRTENI